MHYQKNRGFQRNQLRRFGFKSIKVLGARSPRRAARLHGVAFVHCDRRKYFQNCDAARIPSVWFYLTRGDEMKKSFFSRSLTFLRVRPQVLVRKIADVQAIWALPE